MPHLQFTPSTVIVSPDIQSIMKWLTEFLNVGHGNGEIAFYLFFLLLFFGKVFSVS